MCDLIQECAAQADIPVQTAYRGGMFGFFITNEKVRNFTDAQRLVDRAQFARFFRTALKEGIYLAASPFEAAFVTTAHSLNTIATLRTGLKHAFAQAKA